MKIKKHNMPIYLTTGFVFLLFGAMILFLADFTAKNEETMINNSYNSRQQILLSRNYRGTIFSRDGEVLAETQLDFDQNEKRVYPYGDLFAHVVGYEKEGKMGIEALANFYLINTNLSIAGRVANDTAGVKNPGDNVYTTLDVGLQKLANEQLELFHGALIMTEVKTGRILAMSSNPDFDPNEIETIWEDVIRDKESSVLLNRATQGLYAPGSTFKIVTALEYIRENPDTYGDYSFHCTGKISLEDGLIHCYNSIAHGTVDLKTSFAKSCNSSFANIGVTLDKVSFADTLDKLLFNKDLPFAMSYEKSSVSFDENSTVNDMMQMTIGQGKTLISPLHLNMITCAVANKGILMKPYLLEQVVSAEGKKVKQFEPEKYGRLMTENEAETLTEFMAEVVLSGTAKRKLGQTVYTAAGKTGSAEFNDDGECHAWFTAFAPVEDPQIAVTIVLEGVGEGGDFAVPVVRKLFDRYFEQEDKND